MGTKFVDCEVCRHAKYSNGVYPCIDCKRNWPGTDPSYFGPEQKVRYSNCAENRKPKMVPVMFDEFALQGIHSKCYKELDIQKVILSGRATIIFWNDGTKTVVKCAKGDKYDPEKGIAMAIAKKLFGNKCSYQYKIKKMIKNAEKDIPKKKEKKETSKKMRLVEVDASFLEGEKEK